MRLDSFDYDANHAAIIKEENRDDKNGNTIVRTTLDNGVVFVFTKNTNGLERLDTNFELIKQPNGYYKSDLTSPKKDFHDYY